MGLGGRALRPGMTGAKPLRCQGDWQIQGGSVVLTVAQAAGWRVGLIGRPLCFTRDDKEYEQVRSFLKLFLFYYFYRSIVDLQCCLITAALQSDSVIHPHIFFFIFSIIVYHRIWHIVLRVDLVYPSYIHPLSNIC